MSSKWLEMGFEGHCMLYQPYNIIRHFYWN